MNKLYFLFLVVILLNFNCNKFGKQNLPQKYRLCTNQFQSNKVLKEMVERQILNGWMIENFYKETNSDSLVALKFDFPEIGVYPIDSIYFMCYNGANIKLLAQSEYEKGLIYIEGDSKGMHKVFYDFGGYVQNARIQSVVETKDSIFLDLEYTVWSSTSLVSDTMSIKILSSKFNNEFKFSSKLGVVGE